MGLTWRCPECGHEREERAFDRLVPPPCLPCSADKDGHIKLENLVRMEEAPDG